MFLNRFLYARVKRLTEKMVIPGQQCCGQFQEHKDCKCQAEFLYVVIKSSINISEIKSTFALTTENVTLAIPDPTKGLKLS